MFDTSRTTTTKTRALRYAVLLAIMGRFLAPFTAFGEVLPLSKLEGKLASSLRLKAMEGQIDYSQHLLRREQSREGMQIFGRLDIGHNRQIVTNNLTRNYDALQPHVGLSYPLLGARAQQLEATKAAQTQTQLSSIEFDDARRQLLHQLRYQYTLYWQYSQAEKLTGQYLETLTTNETATRKMNEKGVWLDSEYLRFKNSLTEARDELQRFRAQQRMALNNLHSILGENIGAFQPAQPDFPALCLSSTSLTHSAERHSAELKKLQAQLDALIYNREIGAGSSLNADLHLGVGYTYEYANNRQGYAATVGASISMPAGFQEAERANKDRLNAALVVNRSLGEQAKLDLQLNIAQAFENLQLAQSRLEVMKSQAQAAREALRETKMQFDRVPYPVLQEMLLKMTEEHQAALSEIESHSQLLQRTSDLLLLSPDSCSGA